MSTRVNHAILHVFDFNSCVNVFSEEELDLSQRQTKTYVATHARRALGNIDNKHGEFASTSLFAEEMRAYKRGLKSFTELSIQIAEFMAEELSHQDKPVSTDLLVVDFEEDADVASVQAAVAAEVARECAARFCMTSWSACGWRCRCCWQGSRCSWSWYPFPPRW